VARVYKQFSLKFENELCRKGREIAKLGTKLAFMAQAPGFIEKLRLCPVNQPGK